MKKSENSKGIILVCMLGLALTTCQKEEILKDNQLIPDANAKAAPAPVNANALSEYLSALSDQIEAMVVDETLNWGNGNSLIAKITNTIKSIEKGNTPSINGQLNAFINETESYIDQNILSSEQGEALIDIAENSIFVLEGKFVDSRDGHEYPVVLIGDQIWITENLAYLPDVSPSNFGSGINPYYYVYGYQGTSLAEAKGTYNFKTYGALYNWTSAKTSCPSGWHLPSYDEWTTLVNYSGGLNIAGAVLKETGTSHWTSTNAATTNSTGFTALPGGFRVGDPFYPTYNSFAQIYGFGEWWSATDDNIYNTNSYAHALSLNVSSAVYRRIDNKSSGFSVRCLKD
jgi:uncharacterized protein (TIGR02145 family)